MCAVPFYGLTKHPETQDYAMVMKRTIYGDLSDFLFLQKSKQPKITWIERVEILSSIAKSLNAIHKLDIVHRDLHSRNILVDDSIKIFISDFGLSSSANLQSGIHHRAY